MKESWKDVVGYEGIYQISNLGRLKNRKSIRKAHKHKNGYMFISLSKNGFNKNCSVHRLVATAFCDNPDNKPCVNHLNGVRDVNYSSNLEWVTYSENIEYSIRVLKTMKAPSWRGKFGADHNKSIGFDIKFEDGSIKHYGSGWEFKRETGLCNSTISWMRNNKTLPYTSTRGKTKGLTIMN